MNNGPVTLILLLLSVACLSAYAAPHVGNDDLPASVDWRDHGLVTGVWKEAGCNSSWAIATANVIEAAYAKKTGKLDLLSPQQLSS